MISVISFSFRYPFSTFWICVLSSSFNYFLFIFVVCVLSYVSHLDIHLITFDCEQYLSLSALDSILLTFWMYALSSSSCNYHSVHMNDMDITFPIQISFFPKFDCLHHLSHLNIILFTIRLCAFSSSFSYSFVFVNDMITVLLIWIISFSRFKYVHYLSDVHIITILFHLFRPDRWLARMDVSKWWTRFSLELRWALNNGEWYVTMFMT